VPFKTLPIIQIGGHIYDVELCNSPAVSQQGHQGDSHSQAMSIRVATTLIDGGDRNISDVEEILLHELLHQINIVWGCDIDETNIDRMAQGLLQVLKQFNVKMVKVADEY